MQFDVLIRNGVVIDGSGRPGYRADVGIIGDRIAAIGRLRERGATEIDAEGQVVTPGFIEIHSHMDAQVFWDHLGSGPAWQGVTTSVMGNCGFTLAPCRPAGIERCIRVLERTEDMSRAALLSGVPWTWESFADYLDAVDALPKGINYAGHIGHCSLRAYVMDERAFEERATAEDLAKMETELRHALLAGAIGFSTTRSSAHRTPDNRPVPSCVAEWDEVRALVGVMGKMGVGHFELTPDNYGEPEERACYQAALRDLAVESGRPATFILAQLPAQKGVWREMLALAEETTRRGGRMIPQVHARQIQSLFGFQTQLPFDHLPTWAQVRQRPLDEQIQALRDRDLRPRLVEEAMHGPYRAVDRGAEMRPPDWNLMAVLDGPVGPYETVGSLARRADKTPADVLIDLSLESRMERFFIQPFANLDMTDVLTLLRHELGIVGGSDSGAHVSQIIDSSIPTFLLAYWVREKEAFSFEEAIRKLTFDPAMCWGFTNRGLVGVGHIADLNVLDPKKVGPGMPSVASDLPTNAKRLIQKATGIAATLVSGQVLLRNGEHTGAYPGRLLRGPLAKR
jgi:N-acyl-D-amino-acid deacylase